MCCLMLKCLITLHSCDIWWGKGSEFTEIVQLHVTGSSYSFVHQIFYNVLRGIWSWLCLTYRDKVVQKKRKDTFSLEIDVSGIFQTRSSPWEGPFIIRGKWLSEEKGHAVPPLITPAYRSEELHREPFCCWGIQQHTNHISRKIEIINHK